MLIRRIALPVLATALIAAATAAPASAGKADPSSCSTPTLSGESQRQVGDVYTVAGCGFAPGALVPLEIGEADGCCAALNVLADSSGRFVYSGAVWAPGTYRVRAGAPRRGNARMAVVAEWSFVAMP
jgi:hypothetical protein